ncbi:hypothetical protein Cni_G25188 [Canna indica]|uniref:Uncharacterized protein n=1 Tax=Canna indica TaxID=4628 RepID=A0AAQ3QKT9_9LILI|nr:hypothetical protein Cni_G25188 [Canna indica]
MYTTKPLAIVKNSPHAVPPLAGPNSGYLLLRDEEAEPNPTCCWGLCEDRRVRELPFPQNRILTITYTQANGQSTTTYEAPALFVPVLDKPLSSNHYYVIVAKGSKKGKATASSKEEDMINCCFCRCINDVNPRDFDPDDFHQQFEIIPKRGRFTAKSVLPDGFAPWLLRQHWKLYASAPKDECQLTEASGLDKAARSQVPPLMELPISRAVDSSLMVGKWYTSCVFVKDGALDLKDQMKRSAFYEIALEQRWEEVYACDNLYGDRREVEVKASVEAEAAVIDEKHAVRQPARQEDGGVVWFKAAEGEGKVGLSWAVLERMRWEESRGGWASGEEMVERVEECGGGGGEKSRWTRFGCYVLVERFKVKRMDGSLILAIDFKHTRTIQTKWE